MITVENLVFEYPGKRALDNVTFIIPEGSITALVGPNGAGKTTLLRCIAALDEPFSGTITVAGVQVQEHPRRVHKELGYLSDFFGLYNDLSVRQCLFFSARLHQLSPKKAAEQARWAADMLELTPYLSHKAGMLSRGWRQRLGIAQAIIHNPKLLLLDEPASGLDPEARVSLSHLFRTLRNQGITLVVSSHILAELEDYCTDMLILREGKVLEHRTQVASQQEKHMVEILFLEDASTHTALLVHNHITHVSCQGNRATFQFAGDASAQHALLKTLIERGAKVHSFSVKSLRLQDVYMSLSQEKVPYEI